MMRSTYLKRYTTVKAHLWHVKPYSGKHVSSHTDEPRCRVVRFGCRRARPRIPNSCAQKHTAAQQMGNKLCMKRYFAVHSQCAMFGLAKYVIPMCTEAGMLVNRMRYSQTPRKIHTTSDTHHSNSWDKCFKKRATVSRG